MHGGIRVTFLGTGTSQGVPVIACPCDVCHSADPRDKRLRSSILIESETTTIVIDTGPDFRYQMLRAQVKKLDAVVFTHEHKDHTAGLDDVRAFNFFQQSEMPVYCSENVERALRTEFAYVFHEFKYPGVPLLNIMPVSGVPFTIGDIELVPILVMHYKMPVYGFRIGDFTYITDANYIAPEEIDKVRGSKTVVLNALRKEPHISHFNLDQALEIMHDIQPEQGYLTHISHMLGKHEEVEKTLPEKIRLAYDGLVVECGAFTASGS